MNYLDLGYSRFLTKSLLDSYQSSNSYRSQLPVGAIVASSISAQMNPVTDISFSSTDNDTAGWSAGTIYFANGANSGNIIAGNTGDISAKTYVYYDGDRPGELRTTTDIKTVQSGQKLLVAIVEVGATGKSCKISPMISTGYTGNITAEEIDVSQLDAVAVNTGTLNVDEEITVGNSNVKVDGANKRLIISDGINDRVLLGKLTGAF